MLLRKIFKDRKIGFGSLMVKSHKFWVLRYSRCSEMSIHLELSYFLIPYYI